MILKENQYSIPVVKDIGIKINLSETEIMVWNSNESRNVTDSESIRILNVKLVNTKRFICISVCINYNKFIVRDNETEHNQDCAQSRFFQHCKFLQTKRKEY